MFVILSKQGTQGKFSLRAIHFQAEQSCNRDLNSGPLPYQGSALPLSYYSKSERKTGLKPATPSLEG